MESSEILDNLSAQLQILDLNSLRDYCFNKNITNICYFDSLFNIQSQQKEEQIKQQYALLSQEYSFQLGVRGDGNCFYRAVMLMKIFTLAQDIKFVPLEAFIQQISNLKDIQIDQCAAQVVPGSGLQLIFRLFLMKILSWKKQKIRVDNLMIIKEYNSLPELDFAACSIARFMIYQCFQKYKAHAEIKAFVDEDMQQDIYKNILKQNEYAEGIIILLAAQSFQSQIVIQNINKEKVQPLRITNEGIVYKPFIMHQPNICQIHLVFTKDHYDSFILKSEYEKYSDFYKLPSASFSLPLQNINCYQNFIIFLKKFQLKNQSISSVNNNQLNLDNNNENKDLEISTKHLKNQKNNNDINFEQSMQLKKGQFQSASVEKNDLVGQIPLKQTHSEKSNKRDDEMNFDLRKFASENQVQNEEIDLQNNGFILKKQTPLISANQKSIQNKVQVNTSNLPQSIKKNQVAPAIYENYELQEALIIMNSDSENEEEEKNEKDKKVQHINNSNGQYLKTNLNATKNSQLNNQQIQTNKINIQEQKDGHKKSSLKCISCKGPFKSQKFILEGKKMALICEECVEKLLKDLKKDQIHVVFDNQIFKFGDSIMAKIKEKKLISKSLKNNNIINPKSKTSSSQKKVQPQIVQMIEQQCNFCDKNQFITYEISQILEGGKELIQRVCSDCINMFVLYYKNASKIIQFEDKQFKVSEILGKFIYFLKMQQIEAEVKVQQIVDNGKSEELQKCIICKELCNQRYPIFNINDPQTQHKIGHFCFLFNLHYIQNHTFFIFQNNIYIIYKQLQSLAQKYTKIQTELLNKPNK